MRSLLPSLLGIVLVACGSDSSDEGPAVDAGARDAASMSDAATDAAARDAAVRDDAATAEDASTPDAASERDAGADELLACLLPFEPGPCEAAIAVYTYDAAMGTCVPATYGGCKGNANRFTTEAACLAQCGCPEGESLAKVCVRCGIAGGCGAEAVQCAKRCEMSGDCDSLGGFFWCNESGHCEISGCI